MISPPAPISKRLGSVTTYNRRAFSAKYEGACTTCTSPIAVGDEIFYAPGSENPSGLQCCGDRSDDELVVHQRADDPTVDDEDPADVIARTMPRGKTRRDACPRCWQVPASNGACGCDY